MDRMRMARLWYHIECVGLKLKNIKDTGKYHFHQTAADPDQYRVKVLPGASNLLESDKGLTIAKSRREISGGGAKTGWNPMYVDLP